MAELRTEEEQVEALKRWWRDNGKSLLLTVVVALAAVLGWKGWQQRQAAEAASASVDYQNLLEAVVGSVNADKDKAPAEITTAEHLSESLKKDHDGSVYARLGALLMARVDVEQGKLEKAVAEFDWVLSHKPSDAQKIVATLRKAQVLGEMGKTDDALALLDGVKPGSFEASYQELKGDLLLKAGKPDAARAAYQLAEKSAKGNGSRPLLNMKLSDLATEEG